MSFILLSSRLRWISSRSAVNDSTSGSGDSCGDREAMGWRRRAPPSRLVRRIYSPCLRAAAPRRMALAPPGRLAQSHSGGSQFSFPTNTATGKNKKFREGNETQLHALPPLSLTFFFNFCLKETRAYFRTAGLKGCCVTECCGSDDRRGNLYHSKSLLDPFDIKMQ